jgi:hypothetical protein
MRTNAWDLHGHFPAPTTHRATVRAGRSSTPFSQPGPYGPVRAHVCMHEHAALHRHGSQLIHLPTEWSASRDILQRSIPLLPAGLATCTIHSLGAARCPLASAACGADVQARTGATCRWRASAHRSLECNTSPSPRPVSGKSQRTALVAGELNAVNAPSIQPPLDYCTAHVVQFLAQSPHSDSEVVDSDAALTVGLSAVSGLPSLTDMSDCVCPHTQPGTARAVAATQIWWWEPVGTSWCRWCKGCWRVQPHGKHHDLRRRRAVRRVDDVRRVSTAITMMSLVTTLA